MNFAAPSAGTLGLSFRSDLLNSRPFERHAVSKPLASPQHWYALYTRSRYEKVVDRLLREKGFDAFLPLTIQRSPVGLKRFRDAQIPLFAGYTFVRLPACREKFYEVRATTGVAGIVGSRSGPIFIPDTEIESIQTLVTEKVSCSLSSCFAVGQPVIVARGPLKGVRGELMRRKNRQHFVVRIRLIQRLLEVDLSPGDLEALAPITASESLAGEQI
jgi:transcription termination/antitermination protein NusG